MQNRPLLLDGGGLKGETQCSRIVRHNSEQEQALSGKDAILGVPSPTDSTNLARDHCNESYRAVTQRRGQTPVEET
jgi:hypothetical protein